MPVNNQTVVGIIKKILKFYGYSISSSDISDFLAERDSDHLFIRFETATNYNSIRHFSNNVENYSGKGILILESVDDKTRSFALDQGLSVWDRSELESWVGRAVLSGAFEGQEEPSQSTASFFPDMTIQEEVPKEIPKEPQKKEYEKTIRILLRSVPVNIGKADAISIAEAKVGRSKSQKLKFIPVWYYSYSFASEKKFKSRMIDLKGEGNGYINGLTGENSFSKYNNIQDNTFVPTQNYEIKQMVISKKDAITKAIDAIIKEHSKEMRINEMIGDTIVFENKVFSPDPENINLDLELLHIPIWEIKGSGETIEINGYDGHIMAVKAYSDAEFV